MTTTALTFTGSADPYWLDTAQDSAADDDVFVAGHGSPDPADPKGVVHSVTSLVGAAGAVLVVDWVSGVDDGYAAFLASAAQSAGLTPGDATLGPDTTCSFYDVREPDPHDPNEPTTGVPCRLHRRT